MLSAPLLRLIGGQLPRYPLRRLINNWPGDHPRPCSRNGRGQAVHDCMGALQRPPLHRRASPQRGRPNSAEVHRRSDLAPNADQVRGTEVIRATRACKTAPTQRDYLSEAAIDWMRNKIAAYGDAPPAAMSPSLPVGCPTGDAAQELNNKPMFGDVKGVLINVNRGAPFTPPASGDKATLGHNATIDSTLNAIAVASHTKRCGDNISRPQQSLPHSPKTYGRTTYITTQHLSSRCHGQRCMPYLKSHVADT